MDDIKLKQKCVVVLEDFLQMSETEPEPVFGSSVDFQKVTETDSEPAPGSSMIFQKTPIDHPLKSKVNVEPSIKGFKTIRKIVPITGSQFQRIFPAEPEPVLGSPMNIQKVTGRVSEPALGSSIKKMAETVSEPALGSSIQKMAETVSEPALGSSIQKMAEAVSDSVLGSSMNIQKVTVTDSEPALGSSMNCQKPLINDPCLPQSNGNFESPTKGIKTQRKIIPLTDLKHPFIFNPSYSSLMSLLEEKAANPSGFKFEPSAPLNGSAKLVKKIPKIIKIKKTKAKIGPKSAVKSEKQNGPSDIVEKGKENLSESSTDDEWDFPSVKETPCNPTTPPEELILDDADGTLYTNPSCPMPMVGLTVDAGIGRPLPSLSAKCALTCLDECRTLITSEFAQFCSAVVKSSPKKKPAKVTLPIKDNRIVQLMQIKWNSKCSVIPVSLSGSLDSSMPDSDNSQENKNDSKKQFEASQKAVRSATKRKIVTKPIRHDSEGVSLPKRSKMSLLDNDKKKIVTTAADQDTTTIHSSSEDRSKPVRLLVKSTAESIDSDDDNLCTVMKKTAFEVPEPTYDPDDERGDNKPEEKALGPKKKGRVRASPAVHELRRLNVAIFDMPSSLETVVCKSPDICRLGCVCSSLLSRVIRDNCGLEKCMFGCICRKPPQNSDRGNQSYSWVQNKAKQNLAKEERNFKQTVVRSDNNKLILVEGRRKREIKAPKKYSEDFMSSTHLRVSKTSKEVSIVRAETEPSNSFVFDSARTAFYDYKSSKNFQSKQIQHETYKSPEKSNDAPLLFKIASTHSLDQNDWEYDGTEETANSVATQSCSHLFNTEYVKNNAGSVHVLSWEALWSCVSSKKAYVWYQLSLPKPKIYLTNSSIKPSSDCEDLHSIDVRSTVFLSLPEDLQAFKTGCLPRSTQEVGWVVKYIRSHWMILGLIQRTQPKASSEQSCGEVDVLPSINEDYPSRWWVMDLSQNFDLLYFMDSKKALTKRQMNTLLRLSNEYSNGENKVHRILLNRQRPKLNHTPVSNPDFGAYSVSKHPNRVFIGPYHSFNEPKFQVFSQKAAPNGKTQYIGVPLFYCGSGECVRVNAQGVLSLHSESLPEVYVQGFWYQSLGNKLSESSDKPLIADTRGNKKLESHPKESGKVPLSSEPDGLGLADAVDKKSTEIIDLIENDDNRPSDDESSSSSIEEVIVEKENPRDSSIEIQSPDKPNTLPTDRNDKELFEQLSEHNESMSSSSKSVISSHLKSDDSDETGDLSSAEEDQLKQVYMIPNVPKIGYVTLTYLPGGSISVPHFTESASLKFYREKSEVVKDINRLIHKKLSCLSRKCSALLENNDGCKCVQWRFSNFKSECKEVPRFTPAIFNGFFMLTKYGLLDLRTAQDSVVQELGKDWVDWMKNDQIRLKLQHWKSKEEHEILEKKLKTILNLNKDLPLLEVLSMATSEIAKLKAQDQLLDYESQSQKLLRETLISSLCRKLDGIPADVVPKFLEHLEFSILWEVLECMNTRKTIVISVDNHKNSPSKPHISQSAPRVKTKKKKSRKRSAESREMNTRPEGAKVDLSSRIQALQYMERLREEIRQEEEQMMKKQMGEPEEKLAVASKPSKSGPNDALELKDLLACTMSPFSGINICVDKGGIKYSSTSSPPPLPGTLKGSPEKPSILRKSKGPVGVKSLPFSPSSAQKQARKQVFPLEQEEEPLVLEDPVVRSTSPLVSDFDPISSLRITSVVSGAKSASAPLKNIDDFSQSNPKVSGTHGQGSGTDCTADVDPVQKLQITNVFSTRDISSKSPGFSLLSARSDSVRVADRFQSVSPVVKTPIVVTPSSASKAFSGIPSAFLKLKGTGTPTGPPKANPLICRPIRDPAQKPQIISIPATLIPPKSILLCSKEDGEKDHNTSPRIIKVSSGETVYSGPKHIKTVHVLKDKEFITVRSPGSTPTHPTFQQLMKTNKVNNINPTSSSN